MKTIILSKAEIQSKLDRVKLAELLILQLPDNHDGRNTWLMNYGVTVAADNIRSLDNFPPRELIWDENTNCLKSV